MDGTTNAVFVCATRHAKCEWRWSMIPHKSASASYQLWLPMRTGLRMWYKTLEGVKHACVSAYGSYFDTTRNCKLLASTPCSGPFEVEKKFYMWAQYCQCMRNGTSEKLAAAVVVLPYGDSCATMERIARHWAFALWRTWLYCSSSMKNILVVGSSCRWRWRRSWVVVFGG